MRLLFVSVVVLLISMGMASSAKADLFKNSDLSSGLSGWHGDGRLVYLTADGTETDDAGSASTPAIKLRLSHDPQETSQEFNVRDNPIKMDVSVEVMAGPNFRRSPVASDYNTTWSAGGTWYWTALAVPTVDFWIRGAPGFFYKLAQLKAGQWTPVKGHFENLKPTESYTISFCVPPGDGVVYIRHPSATP